MAAKLEMAADPLHAGFRDRILALANESWAHEIDAEVFDEAQVLALNRRFEAPASTNGAMFELLKDRLSDLDDLLLADTSPKELWAQISQERLMRRGIAHELRGMANFTYTVDQEAVTGDEKETDIRLRSTASPVEAVIELKLADDRTARDLRETIENQLVNRYMAAGDCRSGALVVTLAREREWEHPDEGGRIRIDALVALLNEEADRVQQALGNGTLLAVHFLDLRPRLSVEK